MKEVSHSRRAFLRNTVAAGAIAASPQLVKTLAAAVAGPRPSLVFFLGEGVRWDESSLAGNNLLHTPNIDRIGREGVVFRNAFVTNALCLPSRATILSGMYSHVTGAVEISTAKSPIPFLSLLISSATPVTTSPSSESRMSKAR